MKQVVIDQIIQNPHDSERENFVRLCRENIDYLQMADEDLLRQLYYRTKQGFVEPGQILFDVEDKCDEIIIILHGLIDIVISDGYYKCQILDILGKDSIIGANFVLKQEPWCYNAVNNSSITVKVLRISYNLIYTLTTQSQDVLDHVQLHTERVEIYGLPQIDYVINMNKTTAEEIRNQIINFQKQLIWKEKRFDYVSKWLQIEKLEHELNEQNRDEAEQLTKTISQFTKVEDKIADAKLSKSAKANVGSRDIKTSLSILI